MNIRKTTLALTVLAGAVIGSAAQARDADVQWQVTVASPVIRLPGHVSLPLPPLLVPRVVVSAPAPVYDYRDYRDHREHRDYRDYRDHRGYRDEHDTDYREPAYRGYVYRGYGYRDHGYRESGSRDPRRWDVDGDGIPNRHDRVYNPRWDRDGDGVPNRYDRRPNNPYEARGGRSDERGGYHHGRRD